MDILSLDILKFIQLLLRPWRWLQGKTRRRPDEILRRNVAGLEIVVISRQGRIIRNDIVSQSFQKFSETHGTVETFAIIIDLERSIPSDTQE